MSLWVIDTDTISLFQNAHPNVCRRINAANPVEIAVTIITFEEQVRGRFNAIRKSDLDKLVVAYSRLQATYNFLVVLICFLLLKRLLVAMVNY